jgi:hypothetical protein
MIDLVNEENDGKQTDAVTQGHCERFGRRSTVLDAAAPPPALVGTTTVDAKGSSQVPVQTAQYGTVNAHH